MLVFCILASTHTVKFSGEGTVASEVNGPAFCTKVLLYKSGSPLSFIYPTVEGLVNGLPGMTTHI